MTRVSVAIAVRDGDRYVAAALDSVLAEVGADDEVVVFDDGSTDRTPEILAGYGDRVRVITQPPLGVSAARNRIIAESRGRYLAFLDADDLWVEGCLDLRLRVLEAEPTIDIVVGATEEFLDDGLIDAGAHGLRSPRQHARGLFLGAMVARREAFTSAAFDESRKMAIIVDWLTQAREAGMVFHHLDDVTLRRRIRDSSLTTDAAEYQHQLLSSLRDSLGLRRQTS